MIEQVKNNVSKKVNEVLLQPLIKVKIKEVAFQMHSDKALGPDGMNSTFFQNF